MELIESKSPQAAKLNLKREIRKYTKKWPWLLLSLVLFVAGAQLYLRYAEKVYLTKTSLKFLQNKGGGTASMSALSDLSSMGMGISGNEELLTEIQVLTSKPIYENVVRKLHLNARVYSVGKVKETETYPAPFKVEFKSINPTFKGAVYNLEAQEKNSFKLSGLKETYEFGKLYAFPFGSAIFQRAAGSQLKDDYNVEIRTMEQAVKSLENRITALIPQGKGMIVEVSMNGTAPAKSEIVLNELTRQYNLDGITDKNKEALATQEFISNRLDIITNDLLGIENQKASFKRQNEIADLEAQAQLSLQSASDNTRTIMNLNTQLSLLNAVASDINGGSDRLMPSNIGLPSATEALIGEYNNLVLTRSKTLKQATPSNPAVIEMNKELASMRSLIRKNIADTRNNLNQNIAQLQQQVAADRAKISRFPAQEKISRGIERDLGLKEQLYLYLLQKREENAITLAVTAPKVKVVNPAYTVGVVEPNAVQVLGGAIGLGLLLPLIFFYVKFSLDTKVHTKDDITSVVPDVGVIGEVPQNEETDLVGHNDFSVFAESFRILTSNLKFILKTSAGNKSPVVLVTSSIKGEGKTTVAMNTAIALAGSAKKVIIIGADIRNPQLKRFVKATDGLTEYLVSDEVSPAEFIQESGLRENLDILHSGAIAPNPNDLLDLLKFDTMIEWMKTQYDFIVIDSAPVMLVSDTLSLLDTADSVLYVVKSDHTEREMLHYAKEFREVNHIKSMSFILNGVSPEHSRYGSKYGYGYYHVNESKKSLKTLFKK